ncbi:MAG: carbohydrate ABC transporter permease [Spirochaetales bacterium]|nr:carbohydrate ABC transporter permease [Spirochaetales bacterium]
MKNIKQQRIRRNIIVNILLILICFLMIYPVLYGLMTSFKTQSTVLTIPPTFFPKKWSLEGYKAVLNSDMFKIYLPNTAINAVLSALLTMPLAALAAYSFSRYQYRWSKTLQMGILGLMMIPGLTNLVAIYRIGSVLKLMNTHFILILIYTAGGIPFTIWIIKAFFDAIPRGMEEAARIDGCTPLMSMWHVVIPLSMPGLVSGFLLNFVYCWNEFLAAVILLTANSARTATVGLYDFQSQYEIAYHIVNAACIMIMLPVIITFVIARKSFFRAMMDGALKG